MEQSLNLLDRAIIFATKAHSGETRKGTKIPYIVHPIEVAAIISSMTENEEVIAAAVLHDVIEDTKTTKEELEEEFGSRIADLVAKESENKRKELPPSQTWELRKQETIDSLKNSKDRESKMIALSDRLANMRAIDRDYKIYGESIWNRFNEKRKAKHGWVYRSVADALWEFHEYPVWQEYNRLVEEVFGAGK